MEQIKYFKNNIIGYEYGCVFPSKDNLSINQTTNNKTPSETLVFDNKTEISLNFLQDTYPEFFNSFIKINIDSMKVNVVERYFYYCIEHHQLIQKIESEIDNQEHKEKLLRYFNDCLNFYLKTIILKVKNIYGLTDIEEYLKSNETTLIENPSLLGLCQIIFSKDDFKMLIYHDILYSKNSLENLKSTIFKIAYSIIEAKERIIFFDESIHWIFKHNYSRENILKTLGLTDLENFAKEKSAKELKTIIKKLIEEYSQIPKVILGKNLTQGNLINKINEKIFWEDKNSKADKISEKENLHEKSTKEDMNLLKNEIENFIYKYFQNSKGKSGTYDYNLEFKLLPKHIVNLKAGLSCLKKNKILNDLQISKIISNAFQNFKAFKTVQNS